MLMSRETSLRHQLFGAWCAPMVLWGMWLLGQTYFMFGDLQRD